MSRTAENATHPELEKYDMGVGGDFSTSQLPQTGHEVALDDDQQKTARSASKFLADTADDLSKRGDKVLARRIRYVSNKIASVGIRDTTKNHELFSTSALPESGEKEGPDISGPPCDEDQAGDTLQFYGATAPKPGDAGPESRSASQVIKAELEAIHAEDGEEGVKASLHLYKDEELNEVLPSLDSKIASVVKASKEEACEAKKKKTKKEEKEEKRMSPLLRKGEKKASNEAPLQDDPWILFKKELKRTASKGGRWGQGYWEVKPEFYGRVADLNIETTLDDGTPLVASTVTFSLAEEDKAQKTASVDVQDNAYLHESNRVKINSRTASKLVAEWVELAESVAKSHLEE